MTPSSAATEFRTFLDRAAARVLWIEVAHGAAVGLAVAFVLVLFNIPPRGSTGLSVGVALLLAALGAVVQVARTASSRRNIAHRVEARAPQCRNVVVTADELSRTTAGAPASKASEAAPLVAPPYVGDIVLAEAVRTIRTLDLAALFPTRNAWLALLAGAGFVGLMSARETLPLRTAARAIRRVVPAAAIAIANVEITVTAPAYAAQRPRALRNVARIDALAGSRIRLRVRASADSLVVQTLRGKRTLAPTSADLFTIDIPADEDGFVTLAPRGNDGREGSHQLIGITVQNDQLPHVRIAAPGRDLLLKDSHRTIDLGVEADDDLGLASLRLRYTKVSGSGERFAFSEGEVPLKLTRTSQQLWKASGVFPLDSLGLSAGDMVVYRAVATDHRPGAPSQESDAFILEIVAPGGDAASGFSIDPDQERYAVSQQMVILKTERLIARRATMQADSATNAAQEIAAEQRKVRAEFVFMMGGEMADAPDPDASMTDLNEEAEAEGEADIAAGRLANQGRMALTRATRYMSRAATMLTNVELTEALKSEKAALAQLEQAFSRTRILLRALSERERLDMTRRMSGALTDARSDRRSAATPPADARGTALRRALADIAAVAHESRVAAGARASSVRLSALAEAIFRVDPSSEALRKVSTRLSAASALMSSSERTDEQRTNAPRTHARRNALQQQLDSATAGLASVLRGDAPNVAPVTGSIEQSQLRGALGDALRAAGAAAARAGRVSPPAPRPTAAPRATPMPPQR